MLSTWLISALDQSHISQAELARRLSQVLNRSFDRSQINKMALGKRDIGAEELLAIEKITGVQAPKLLTQPQEKTIEHILAAVIGSYMELGKELGIDREMAEELARAVLATVEEPVTGADPLDFESARRVLAASATRKVLKSKKL